MRVARLPTLLLAVAFAMLCACDPTTENNDNTSNGATTDSIKEEALRVWTMHSAALRPGEAPPALNQPPPRFGDHLAAVLENVLAVAAEEDALPPSLIERAAELSIRVIAYQHLWEVSADPFVGAGCFFVDPKRVRMGQRDVLCIPHAFRGAHTAQIGAHLFQECERFAVLAINTIDARVVDVLTTRDTPHLQGQLGACRYLRPSLIMVLTEFDATAHPALESVRAIFADGGDGLETVEDESGQLLQVDRLVGAELNALRVLFGASAVASDDAELLEVIGATRMRLPAAVVAAHAEGAQLGKHVAFIALSEGLATSLLVGEDSMKEVIGAIQSAETFLAPQTQPQ